MFNNRLWLGKRILWKGDSCVYGLWTHIQPLAIWRTLELGAEMRVGRVCRRSLRIPVIKYGVLLYGLGLVNTKRH